MATSTSGKSTTDAPEPETPEVADDLRDVVAMPSLKADRTTPDQTPGFAVLDADGAAADPDAFDDPRKA